MKNKISLSFIIFVLFFVVNISALQQILVIDVTLFKNNQIILHNIYLSEGTESSEFVSTGYYNIFLKDKSGRILYSRFLQLNFKAVLEPLPGEENVPHEIELDKIRLLLKLPYTTDIHKFQLLKENTLIFETEIKLCNNNKVCEYKFGENYLSCSNDCSSSSLDNYCDGILDGKCDQDCVNQGRSEKDVDCTCGNKVCDERENDKVCPEDCNTVNTYKPISFWQWLFNLIGGIF